MSTTQDGLTIRFDQWVAVESRLCVGGSLGKEIEQEEVRFPALSFGRLEEAADNAVVFQTFLRAGALDDFAHDDHRAQTLFGLVIGRGDPGMPEAR